MKVTRIARGAFRVEHDGGSDLLYVADRGHERWVFWNGHVFRIGAKHANVASANQPGRASVDSLETLTAPMPARIVQVLVKLTDRVKKADTVVLLEAMKMELPVRAPFDGVVTAVHGTAGELVQADAPLVDLKVSK